MKKVIAILILASGIILNLVLYKSETNILADPNDNVFQYSLVYRTNWVWENYGCPLSLECLPNLLDHNVTYWAEGYSLPFYYSHLPQIAIVTSYNLIIRPIASIFPASPAGGNFPFSLFNYYNWTKYLLLSFFPLSVFWALRLVGFSPLASALASLFAANYSTDGLYGIDPPSFLWRGYGLTSQLYAMFFMPLALAFTFRALVLTTGDAKLSASHMANDQINTDNIGWRRIIKFSKIAWRALKTHHANSGARKFYMRSITDRNQHVTVSSYTFWAIIFLTLTTAGHLGMGIMSLLIISPFIFLPILFILAIFCIS